MEHAGYKSKEEADAAAKFVRDSFGLPADASDADVETARIARKSSK